MAESNLLKNLQTAISHLKRDLLSQSAVARKLGVSEPTISKWRRGLSCPSDDRVDRIADAMGIDPRHFFAPPAEFATQLAARPAIAPDRRVAISLDAIDHHRAGWPAAWRTLNGQFKYIYAHREGLLEISDLTFAALGPDRVTTYMRNSNTEEGYSWEYRGQSVVIESFVYTILGEQHGRSELFFMICSLPVGDRQGVMYGHLLARSVRGASRVSKVSPCVLIPVTHRAEVGDLHGTYDPRQLIELGILNVAMQRHLTDDPTAALTAHFTD